MTDSARIQKAAVSIKRAAAMLRERDPAQPHAMPITHEFVTTLAALLDNAAEIFDGLAMALETDS